MSIDRHPGTLRQLVRISVSNTPEDAEALFVAALAGALQGALEAGIPAAALGRHCDTFGAELWDAEAKRARQLGTWPHALKPVKTQDV